MLKKLSLKLANAKKNSRRRWAWEHQMMEVEKKCSKSFCNWRKKTKISIRNYLFLRSVILRSLKRSARRRRSHWTLLIGGLIICLRWKVGWRNKMQVSQLRIYIRTSPSLKTLTMLLDYIWDIDDVNISLQI